MPTRWSSTTPCWHETRVRVARAPVLKPARADLQPERPGDRSPSPHPSPGTTACALYAPGHGRGRAENRDQSAPEKVHQPGHRRAHRAVLLLQAAVGLPGGAHDVTPERDALHVVVVPEHGHLILHDH